MPCLAIGTAHFGQNYGVANGGRAITDRSISEILETAKASGIDIVDTAAVYGNCEERLANFDLAAFRVISKIRALGSGDYVEVGRLIENRIIESTLKLRLPRIYGILVHRAKDLLSAQGEVVYSALEAARSCGLIEKIGVSIYDGDEADAILSHYDFDIIQAPINVFDQRLIESGHIERLGKSGVSIHARSVYLQGLLLMNIERQPKQFSRYRYHFENWQNRLRELNMTPLEASISFVSQQKYVDAIIVGAFDNKQLIETIEAFKNRRVLDLTEFRSDDARLIDPRLWE